METDAGNTKAVWVYDLRANMAAFGKTKPLTVQDFTPFEKAFGNDPFGKAKRKDEGLEGRFRCFTRKQIEDRNDNLNLSWLKDSDSEQRALLMQPEDIAAAIVGRLKAALGEIEELSDELKGNENLRSVFKGDVTKDWRKANSDMEARFNCS